jgi:BMFP domain-containing protein YqiC
MKKTNFLENLAKNLTENLPENLKTIKLDLEKNFHTILHSTFNKLELVTREEFDAQTKVLARCRKKIEELTTQLKDLEKNLKKK